FCYHRDALWRDHFRSTPAHNTVTVDGLNQSKMLGPFMWGRRARAEQIAWATTARFDYFEGAHDGYARVSGVRHRRSVLFGKRGYWLVVDHLEGEGRHRISATFQLARGFSRGPGCGLAFASDDGRAVEFRTWLPGGMTTEILEGVDAPPRGWVSDGFGQKDAAPAVVAGGVVELPVTLLTAVIPFDGENAVAIDCLTGEWNGGAIFEITFPEGRDRVLLGAPGAALPDERFSGTLGFAAERESGRETVGLDVTEWTKAGSDVIHEPVVNILSARGTRGARLR
ncbi:MAG: heparinase II/III-family protein, partial [Candidatus Eisenbacteria sp.]|nr:heparinase II/III-family protein [Candidatus Eisenbacteria bacterium]